MHWHNYKRSEPKESNFLILCISNQGLEEWPDFPQRSGTSGAGAQSLAACPGLFTEDQSGPIVSAQESLITLPLMQGRGNQKNPNAPTNPAPLGPSTHRGALRQLLRGCYLDIEVLGL